MLCVGLDWEGMVIKGHRSFKSTFGAKDSNRVTANAICTW